MSTRRKFIQQSTVLGAGIMTAPHLTFGIHNNQDKLKVGLIGVGLRGTTHLNNVLFRNDVIVTAPKEDFVKEEAHTLKKIFTQYPIYIYPPAIQVVRGKYRMHGLIKVPREKWPDENLHKLLLSLPPYFSVAVDPLNLL